MAAAIIAHLHRRLALAAGLLCASTSAQAHEFGLKGEKILHWRTDQISRVVATRISNLHDVGRLVAVGRRKCLNGSGFSFDVDDEYAFDLDETVDLDVELLASDSASRVSVKYERNGEAEATKEMQVQITFVPPSAAPSS